MSNFFKKWLNLAKTCVLAPEMLWKGAGGKESGLLDIRNMTRMDSIKVTGRSGCLSTIKI